MDDMIERVAAAIEGEIDSVPAILADPLTIRRIRAKRIALAAIKAINLPALLEAERERAQPDFINTSPNALPMAMQPDHLRDVDADEITTTPTRPYQ